MSKRVDQNHSAIVKGLRAVGASVQSIAAVGKGCPDLLVGFRGLNVVLEVKDGDRSPSRRKLTDDEGKWHEAWRGQVSTVYSLDDALQAIGATSPGI